MFPEHERDSRLQGHDVLVDGVNRADEFNGMLTSWLERDDLWRDVRTRLATYTYPRSQFGADRIVGLANLFDVLPIDYPPLERNSKIEQAITECRQIFQDISPDASTRAMNALGRMHARPLRAKVKLRAQVLTDRIGERIPDIGSVIDAAIRYRNYLVHGSGTP